jgi:hypothetical protein
MMMHGLANPKNIASCFVKTGLNVERGFWNFYHLGNTILHVEAIPAN